MKNFIYNTPTKVYFGKDTHLEVGKIIKEYGFSKIMLMYGMGSVKKSGLLDVITKALSENDIEYVEMGGVEPNPKLDYVRAAAKIAREQGVELVLAVGGGSAIDAAKYTAAAAYNNCDPWDFPTGKCVPNEGMPVACILTIAAAGSEMSCSAVISNTELNMKRGFNNEINRCLFSICNPELTYSVSHYQTACGIVDIMAHTMERYFTVCDDTEITDRVSEGVLKAVISSGKKLKEDPCDYDARASMMWASSISHNGLTGAGRENSLCVHQLEHALSGEYDEIAHGAGLAILFPAWARYVYKHNVPRFAQFARNVWDVTEMNDEKAAVTGIDRMAEFFASIGMPQKIADFGIGADKIDRLAELTTYGKTRTVKSYIELGFNEIRDIFAMCI